MIVHEKLSQLRRRPRAEGADRLLDQTMKQALDKSILGVLAAGQKGCELSDAGKLYLFSGAGFEGASGINGPALLLIALTADGVKVFQCEAQRVNHFVAGLAVLWPGLQSNPLASGQLRVKLRRQGSESLGRRPQRHA